MGQIDYASEMLKNKFREYNSQQLFAVFYILTTYIYF